jgi:hypothetical protein
MLCRTLPTGFAYKGKGRGDFMGKRRTLWAACKTTRFSIVGYSLDMAERFFGVSWDIVGRGVDAHSKSDANACAAL